MQIYSFRPVYASQGNSETRVKRMHYLKRGLNISLLIAFTGNYKRAKLQTVMFWQHRFTRLQFWATGFLHRLHLFQKIFVETAA